jgi:hypothetical protein
LRKVLIQMARDLPEVSLVRDIQDASTLIVALNVAALRRRAQRLL